MIFLTQAKETEKYFVHVLASIVIDCSGIHVVHVLLIYFAVVEILLTFLKV